MQVFIGTENGSLGSLDIASHNYRTLLRSHTDAVNAMCIDHTGACCITGSSDGTVRVWDIATRQQQCAPPVVLHAHRHSTPRIPLLLHNEMRDLRL